MSGDKTCPACGVLRDLRYFALDASRSNGRASWCLGCAAQRARDRYRSTAERLAVTRDEVQPAVTVEHLAHWRTLVGGAA